MTPYLVLADAAPSEYEVTPGLVGFLATFALALAFLVLVRSFLKHARRIESNQRREERLAALAAAEAEVAAATGTELAQTAGPARVTESSEPTASEPAEPVDTPARTESS